MRLSLFEHFFKPEVRSSGRSFVTKDKVSISQPSDTEIQSYVRASTSFKVIFKTAAVESETLTVSCTCPPFKKGQFCKHIWAALLVIEEKKPDFLEGKTELDKKSVGSAETLAKSPISEARLASQADYRKLQYQKQKLRLNQMKQAKKNPAPESKEYPPSIEEALKYFSENGFELRDSMTKDAVGAAMKKLARVFHPDVGGSHAEILELNRYADILTKFSV